MCQKFNFIHHIIEKDLASGKYINICTRFPPEPNGPLHIGHAKAICLNFDIAQYYHGKCNLRFDDTNPETEHTKYIESIKYDIRWLGFIWNQEDIHYTSDYYDKLYHYAIELIQKGLAYVDELSIEEIKKYRGTLKCAGMNSPYRARSIKENLIYFSKMRDGGFPEKSACLRAKINMSSSVIVMRDPVLYRIKYTTHHHIKNNWCIYPTYDFSHCIADAIEGITHSLCTLEFQDNRILYNWILNNINISKNHPTQYEFARLNLAHVITSKRKLNILVKNNIVDGWDDPRMPTIAGLRRKGYTPNSIREFCRRIGISKQANQIELSALETCIRADLNKHAPRLMAVLNPIKIKIDNLPEGYEEIIIMPNHPNNSNMGVRNVIFSQEIFIDHIDFLKILKTHKHYKLKLNIKIKLRYAYIINIKYLEKDENEKIICIHCDYDPSSLQHSSKYNKKIHKIIHWVSAVKNITAEFRLYDKLFINPTPVITKNILADINPNSLIISKGFVEINILNFSHIGPYQFEREGYFIMDNFCNHDTSYLIFNRTVALKNHDIYKNII